MVKQRVSTPEIRQKVIDLKVGGMPAKTIACMCGIDIDTTYTIINNSKGIINTARAAQQSTTKIYNVLESDLKESKKMKRRNKNAKKPVANKNNQQVRNNTVAEPFNGIKIPQHVYPTTNVAKDEATAESNTRKKRTICTPEIKFAVLKDYTNNPSLNFTELGKIHGISQSSVSRIIDAAGISKTGTNTKTVDKVYRMSNGSNIIRVIAKKSTEETKRESIFIDSSLDDDFEGQYKHAKARICSLVKYKNGKTEKDLVVYPSSMASINLTIARVCQELGINMCFAYYNPSTNMCTYQNVVGTVDTAAWVSGLYGDVVFHQYSAADMNNKDVFVVIHMKATDDNSNVNTTQTDVFDNIEAAFDQFKESIIDPDRNKYDLIHLVSGRIQNMKFTKSRVISRASIE